MSDAKGGGPPAGAGRCQRCFISCTHLSLSKLLRDKVVQTAWFEFIILVAILANCVITAIQASSYVPVGQVLDNPEIVFTAIFTVEIILKLLAWGCWGMKTKKENDRETEQQGVEDWNTKKSTSRAGGGGSVGRALCGWCASCGTDWSSGEDDKVAFMGYFGSGPEAAWNWLDFLVVVLSSYLPLILAAMGGASDANLTPIRGLRVLRPLRTIRWIPQLRSLIDAIISSLSQLLQVWSLLFFIFLIFAIMGIDLFVDAWFYNADISCQGESNNCDSVLGFNNFFYSLLTVFQIVSLEGWSAVEAWLYDRGYPMAWPFFVIIIVCVSFYAMNLVLSVIVIVYERIQKRVQNESRKANVIDQAVNMMTMRNAGHRGHLKAKNDEGMRDAAVDDLRKEMQEVDVLDAREETDKVVTAAKDKAGGDMRADKIKAGPGSLAMFAEFQKQLEEIEMQPAGDEKSDDDDEEDSDFVDILPNQFSRAKSVRELDEEKKKDTHNRTTARKILQTLAAPVPNDWVESHKLQSKEGSCWGKFIMCNNKLSETDFTAGLWFDRIIIMCILANMVTLCLTWYSSDPAGMPPLDLACNLAWVNIIFTIIFTLEAVIKLFGLGFSGYVADGFNVFDGLIVLVSLIEIIIDIATSGTLSACAPEGSNYDPGALTALRIFRVMRVLRVFRVYGKLKSLRQILNSVVESMKGVFFLFILLLLVMFVFGVMGVTLYKNKSVRHTVPILDSQFKARAEMMCRENNYWDEISKDPNFKDWALECADIYSGLDGGMSKPESPGPDNKMQAYADKVVADTAKVVGKLGKTTWDALLDGASANNKGVVETCLKDLCFAKHRGQYFENFGMSFVTVFQVMTGDNWFQVMQSTTEGTGNGLDSLFFVVVLILGKYIILNLFIAIILSKMADEDDWKFLVEDLKAMGAEYLKKLTDVGDSEMVTVDADDDALQFVDAAYNELDARPSQITCGAKVRFSDALGEVKAVRDDKLDIEVTVTQKMYDDKYQIIERKLTEDVEDKRRKRKEEVHAQQQKRHNKYKGGASLETKEGCRASVGDITNSEYFEWFMTFIIVLSCGFLAYEGPMMDPNSTESTVLYAFDFIFAFIFIVEAVLLIIAHGVWSKGEDGSCCTFDVPNPGYFQSGWNILDFLVVIFSVIALVPAEATGSNVTQILRALRAIRPVRLAIRVPQIRVVFEAMLHALVGISYTFIFIAIFWLIMAIIGLQLFNGGLGYCEVKQDGMYSAKVFLDSTEVRKCNAVDQCILHGVQNVVADSPACTDIGGLWTAKEANTAQQNIEFCGKDDDGAHYILSRGAALAKDHCSKLEADSLVASHVAAAPAGSRKVYAWASPTFNFDNIGQAFWTVFKLSTMSSWYQEMYATWYSQGQDESPKHDSNLLSPFYSIIVVLFGGFFTINIVIAVVVDSFNKTKNDTNSSALMTEAQAATIRTQRISDRIPLQKLEIPAPQSAIRKSCHGCGVASWFDNTITAIILVNTIVMCLRWHNQQDVLANEETGILRILDYVFVGIYTVEAIIKLGGFGFYHYFSDSWNLFDFIVVIFGWAGFIVDWAGASTGINLSVVRLFRVLRILRIVKRAKVIRVLFQTLSYAFPSIINVGMLVFIIFYIYAVFGVKTFGSRGTDGYVIPAACKDGSPTYGEIFNFDGFGNAMLVLLRVATYDEWESVYCWMASQNDAAWLYFFTFNFFGTLFMLNLFIAVMLDTLRDNTAVEDNLDTLEKHGVMGFKDAWCERDALRRGKIPATDLKKVLSDDRCRQLVGAILAKVGQREQSMPEDNPDLEREWEDYEEALKAWETGEEEGLDEEDNPKPVQPADEWPLFGYYGSLAREDDARAQISEERMAEYIDDIFDSGDLPLLVEKSGRGSMLEQIMVGYGDALYAVMQLLCSDGHPQRPIKSRPMTQQFLTDWHRADPDRQMG